ncbi:MAG: hypothetical protein J1E57_11015 [Prevotella sp.]|nr:hypothetical protein [Prevotella sp.]
MLIVVPFICSCSGSDEIEETVQELTGSVSFSIDMPGDGGEGTVSSPIVVGMGESLDMKIRQQNSYTATDGTVHTCEPVATIALHAESDTITARDLQELLRVGDTAGTNTSTSGSNPLRSSTHQTFTVGGQRIVFDLSHEIFSITNSAGNAVEMPYLKVNPANFGNSSASETRSGAFVSGVSVRPVQADVTRAGTIVDSTKYEVEVRFNLDLEGVHTSSATRRNLVFAVSYIGIVEEVTQLYDPKSELTFSWSRGTSAASSPFVWNIKGTDKSLVLTLNEKSEYTSMFGHTMSCSPKAQIALQAESDTVYVKLKDELEDKGTVSTPQVSQTGNNPVKNTASYSLGASHASLFQW